MKYAPWIIVVGLIIALLWQDRRSRGVSEHYSQVESVLKRKQDSLKTILRATNLEAIKALTALNLAKAEIQTQKVVTDTYRKRYENARSMPVPRLTDAGIDSAIARLYGSRPR